MNKTLDSLTLPAPTASVTDRLRYLIKLSRLTHSPTASAWTLPTCRGC